MQKPQGLPTELTIYTMGALHAECLGWVEKISKPRKTSERAPKPWLLDASRVDEVDAAGIQLLVALSHSLAAKNRKLQLINPSSPITNACRNLGMACLLVEATDSDQ